MFGAAPDFVLIAVLGALVGLGLIMIYSASSATAYAAFHDTAYYLKRQAMWLVVATLAAYAAYRCDYRALQRLATPAIMLCLLGLIAVLIPHVGFMAGGARRWLGVSIISFQPSEFAKLGLVLYLAAALANRGDRIRSFAKGLAPLALVVGACAVLVLKEPDVGTASLLVFTAVTMFFVAGARLEHLGVMALATLPLLVATIFSSEYKRQRILAFLDPWKDPQNTGFHIIQSLLALGSGGLVGVGLGASRQKFFYLPEQYTDFVFAILGEELGLLGALVVVALFVVLAHRGIRIALAAPDRFGFFLAVGCTSTIVIQAFVNIGVVTSSWPVTGVPLPFISFGGSSLVVSLVCAALLLNIGKSKA